MAPFTSVGGRRLVVRRSTSCVSDGPGKPTLADKDDADVYRIMSAFPCAVRVRLERCYDTQAPRAREA